MIPGVAGIVDPSTLGSADGPVVPDGDDPAIQWSHVMLLVQLIPVIQDEVDPVVLDEVASMCDDDPDEVAREIPCEDALEIPAPVIPVPLIPDDADP